MVMPSTINHLNFHICICGYGIISSEKRVFSSRFQKSCRFLAATVGAQDISSEIQFFGQPEPCFGNTIYNITHQLATQGLRYYVVTTKRQLLTKAIAERQ